MEAYFIIFWMAICPVVNGLGGDTIIDKTTQSRKEKWIYASKLMECPDTHIAVFAHPKWVKEAETTYTPACCDERGCACLEESVKETLVYGDEP